jgi:hypothetical protein
MTAASSVLPGSLNAIILKTAADDTILLSNL